VEYGIPEVTVNGSVAGNLSSTGISLKVQSFVPIGTTLELQLRLGLSPKVHWTKARVVRVRQVMSDECYEIGLRFIKDENLSKSIGEYIDILRSESMKPKELESYG
jgi:hypothetical protein